jgi:tetratricopeptide (TPR) repeat protein
MNTVDLHRDIGPLNEAKGVLRQGGALHGDYEKVEKSLGDYLSRKPASREARLLRGIALVRQGRLSEGEAVLKALLNESLQDPVMFNGLGVIWLLEGKFQDALGAFMDAIELDPTRAEYQYNLGETHKRLGKLNAASMAYARAAELDPDFIAAYNNLGVTLFKLGQPQKALFFLSQLLERDPSHAKARKNREAVQQAQDEGQTELSLEEDTDPFFVFLDEADEAPEDRPAEAAEAPVQAPEEPAAAKRAGISDRESVLELLRFLRILAGALPPKARQLYSTSDTRLAMEFIIGALEGHTGLFRELREKGLVPEAPSDAGEALPASADLADTLDYLRTMAASLAKGELGAVLNHKVEGIISEIQG